MSLRHHWYEINWTLRRKWFGVWEVKDYFTNLEQRALSGAKINMGFVLMVVASAILATGGLLINNAAVIIGSMCVAPFLGPSRAVCIGGLFRNRKIFLGGLLKQLFGLLIIGAGVAYAITALLRASVPGVEITSEILLRSMPTTRDVILSIMIAVAAGMTASLSLTADPSIVETPWGQVFDAVIGVEIAISLIPPAAVVGIGLAFGAPEISRNAFLLLLVNVLGLDIFGSMLMLTVRGIKRKYLDLEKKIRVVAESALAAAPGVTALGSTIHVTLLADTAAKVNITVHRLVADQVPDSLAENISALIQEKVGCRSEVSVELIPTQMYSML